MPLRLRHVELWEEMIALRITSARDDSSSPAFGAKGEIIQYLRIILLVLRVEMLIIVLFFACCFAEGVLAHLEYL